MFKSFYSLKMGKFSFLCSCGRSCGLLVIIFGLFACSPQAVDRALEVDSGNSNRINQPVEDSTTKMLFEAGKSEESKSLCEDYQPVFITDLEVHPVIPLQEPHARHEFLDPVFGSCLVRVTDHNEILDPEEPEQGLKNEYSRVQSFNADGSYFIIYSTRGNWYLYDANSLELQRQLPIGVEPRWDTEDPDLLYFFEHTALRSYRISNGAIGTIHDFSDDLPMYELSAVWTRFEGSPSIDTHYWGLMAEDADWNPVALLIYDIVADEVTSLREIDRDREIDSVSISPLGNYLLVFHDDHCDEGQPGDVEHPCGLMVYDRDLQGARNLLRLVGHADLALDEHGREVLVYQDIDTDYISMLDLKSGEITPLSPIDFSHSGLGFHFSGRGCELPGWVLVSTSNGAQPSATWMDDQIFALQLKPGGKVVRFAHSRSVVDEYQEHDYWAEPHASVNQDFTRIIFTSNWGRSGTEQVDTYLIELPKDWMENLEHE